MGAGLGDEKGKREEREKNGKVPMKEKGEGKEVGRKEGGK